MHSWELITNSHAKKVLCHCGEVTKNFRCCTTDCAFYTVIGGWKILRRKQPTLMEPEESAEWHQTLSSLVGLGTRLGHIRCYAGWKPYTSFNVIIKFVLYYTTEPLLSYEHVPCCALCTPRLLSAVRAGTRTTGRRLLLGRDAILQGILNSKETSNSTIDSRVVGPVCPLSMLQPIAACAIS